MGAVYWKVNLNYIVTGIQDEIIIAIKLVLTTFGHKVFSWQKKKDLFFAQNVVIRVELKEMGE